MYNLFQIETDGEEKEHNSDEEEEGEEAQRQTRVCGQWHRGGRAIQRMWGKYL